MPIELIAASAVAAVEEGRSVMVVVYSLTTRSVEYGTIVVKEIKKRYWILSGNEIED